MTDYSLKITKLIPEKLPLLNCPFVKNERRSQTMNNGDRPLGIKITIKGTAHRK